MLLLVYFGRMGFRVSIGSRKGTVHKQDDDFHWQNRVRTPPRAVRKRTGFHKDFFT